MLVARGRSDGRTVILVPEVKAGTPTGITLLHVRFHDRLDAATMRSVLVGYDRRYDRLVDWVTETEGAFDDSPARRAARRRAADRADLRRRRPLAAVTGERSTVRAHHRVTACSRTLGSAET